MTRTKELINHAYKNGYAIPAINVSNLETILGAFEAANESNSPIIFQIAKIQSELQGVSFQTIIEVIHLVAKDFGNVKYGVHCDHYEEIDVERLIESGFDSIMYDGSKLPFNENLKNSIIVSNKLKNENIGIELEVGGIGGNEGDKEAEEISQYTNVEELKLMVKETDVDYIAVAIGNAHGFYKGLPKINFPLLEKISTEVNVPLVLHGGTGIPKEDVQKCIKNGVAKVNFFTTVDHKFMQAIDKNELMIKAFQEARKAFKDEVKNCIKICMSGGKAWT